MAEVTRVVSVSDSALDTKSMGAEKTIEYVKRRDPALVIESTGKRLTWFTIRRIPTSLFTGYVMSAASDGDRRKRAFQAGLVRVENLIGSDGVTRAVWEPTGEASSPSGPLKVVSDRELELFAPVYVEEIGSVCEGQSFLAPGNAASLRLPQLSLHVLEQRFYLDADASPTVATATSSAASAPERQSTSDADGAARTDATVTASPTT